MNRIQRRRARRKRFLELHIARRFYWEARATGLSRFGALSVACDRVMKRVFLPVIKTWFDSSPTAFKRMRPSTQPVSGKEITLPRFYGSIPIRVDHRVSPGKVYLLDPDQRALGRFELEDEEC